MMSSQHYTNLFVKDNGTSKYYVTMRVKITTKAEINNDGKMYTDYDFFRIGYPCNTTSECKAMAESGVYETKIGNRSLSVGEKKSFPSKAVAYDRTILQHLFANVYNKREILKDGYTIQDAENFKKYNTDYETSINKVLELGRFEQKIYDPNFKFGTLEEYKAAVKKQVEYDYELAKTEYQIRAEGLSDY